MQDLALPVLVFARVAGIVAAAPGFGLAEVPLKLRFAVAAVLVPVMAPIAHAGSAASGVELDYLPLFALKEAAVGLAIGFAGSLLFYGIGMAGQLVAHQMGFLGGSPGLPAAVGGAQSALGAGPISRFYCLLGVLTYFTIDGHHWLLAAVARAYERLPVDRLLPQADVAQPLTALCADMFVVALQVAAPVLAALFLVDIAMAAAARSVPALSPFTVGLPVRSAVGLVGLAVSAPLVGAAVVGHAEALHRALLDIATGL